MKYKHLYTFLFCLLFATSGHTEEEPVFIEIKAGPVFSNKAAQKKCPEICEKEKMKGWNGDGEERLG